MTFTQTPMDSWQPQSAPSGVAEVEALPSANVSAIAVVTPATVVDKSGRRRQARRLRVGRDGIFPW